MSKDRNIVFTRDEFSWIDMKFRRMYKTSHAIAKGTALGTKKDPGILKRKTFLAVKEVRDLTRSLSGGELPEFITMTLKPHQVKIIRQITEDFAAKLTKTYVPEYEKRISIKPNEELTLKLEALKKLLKLMKSVLGKLQ